MCAMVFVDVVFGVVGFVCGCGFGWVFVVCFVFWVGVCFWVLFVGGVE